MKAPSEASFKHRYETHLRHLKLKGLQPKAIEAYARAIRRVGAFFDDRIHDLSEGSVDACYRRRDCVAKSAA